jgi:P-type conjugative transfer ATPase TrbB
MHDTETLTALKNYLNFIPDVLGRYSHITEIMANEDGKIWVDSQGSLILTQYTLPPEVRRSVIDLLAGYHGLICDDKNPSLSIRLPVYSGGRFQSLRPPVVSAPIFSLRIPAKNSLSLDDLAAANTLRLEQAARLVEAVRRRKNIIIAGGTGSGKTTLTGALANLVQDERVILIEDNPELKLANRNTTYLLTGKDFSLSDAVVASLRLRPDRILVGEIRDGQTALGLLEAWLTGHPGGIATIHANSTAGVYDRLAGLIGRVTVNVPYDLIKETLDVIVFIQKVVDSGGAVSRRVTDIKSSS